MMYSRALSWLLDNGVYITDMRCEFPTMLEDIVSEVMPEWTQDRVAALRLIGIGIEWQYDNTELWAFAALEFLRRGGIVIEGGAASERTTPQGHGFYAALDEEVLQDEHVGKG